jgi:universal stress protein A
VQRVLVATDFSTGGERALEYGAEIAATLAVPLVLVHVVKPTVMFAGGGPWPHIEADTSALRAAAEVELCRCQDQARAAHVPAVELVIAKGEPALEILRVATERRCDLIVLGPHGRRHPPAGLGSVAERVVKGAPCAVLIAGRDRAAVSP